MDIKIWTIIQSKGFATPFYSGVCEIVVGPLGITSNRPVQAARPIGERPKRSKAALREFEYPGNEACSRNRAGIASSGATTEVNGPPGFSSEGIQ